MSAPDALLLRRVEKGRRTGEAVYSASGQTDAGRYLIVVFVHKRDGRALILSARDMTRNEVTYYALDKELSQMLSEVAEERGISAGTLLNLWVQEKLWQDASPETA